MARLEKACLLLGVGASWKSKAVASAGHGLSEAGGRSFSPRPAISRSQLCGLVMSRSLQEDLALIALQDGPVSSAFHQHAFRSAGSEPGRTWTPWSD